MADTLARAPALTKALDDLRDLRLGFHTHDRTAHAHTAHARARYKVTRLSLPRSESTHRTSLRAALRDAPARSPNDPVLTNLGAPS